jgi:ATP:ADP antiporter, AAA family
MAELWGSAGVPLLFWSFANSIISFNQVLPPPPSLAHSAPQSKRMYPLMSLVGNFAPIVSGIYVTYLAKYLKAFSPLSDDHIFERSLQCSSLVMTGSIAMIAFLHSLLTKAAIKEQVQLSSANTSTTSEATPPSTTPHPVPTTTPASPPLSARESKPQRKRPLSIRESFGVLATDKYLTNIAKMVLSYGLAIEFTEILWKAIVKKGLTPLCLSLTFLSSPLL